MLDKKHNTLVYIGVSSRIVSGSPANSISCADHAMGIALTSNEKNRQCLRAHISLAQGSTIMAVSPSSPWHARSEL
jgi:hypothetical protein